MQRERERAGAPSNMETAVLVDLSYSIVPCKSVILLLLSASEFWICLVAVCLSKMRTAKKKKDGVADLKDRAAERKKK